MFSLLLYFFEFKKLLIQPFKIVLLYFKISVMPLRSIIESKLSNDVIVNYEKYFINTDLF
jgi:hypothetical protein